MNHWDTDKKVRGIYKVTNKVNGKVYIGQSVDIGRRWRQHMTAKDDFYFHKAIRKYGIENFEWEVIEQCKKKDLDEREIYWIEYYDSFNNGYNCTKGGDVGPVMYGEANSNWKGGISSSEYLKQYREANKEELKKKQKEYYEANKEKRKEYYKQHYKQYYEVNKEKRKEYREAHKEKAKEYREAHKEKAKEYYEVHKEELKEKRRQRNTKIFE